MATVNVSFVRPHILNGAVVAASGDVESESITSSGSSQATDIAADNQKVVARIAVSGGAVWVTFASAPTAAAETTFLLPDGVVEYFSVNTGDKVAVIDA
jgi:hypothetical protein